MSMQMNLKKKIFAGILIGIIGILGLTGCKSEDAKTVFTEAQIKNAALDSIDMDMNMVMNLSMDEESIIVKSRSGSKFSGLQEKENILMQMETVFSYETGEEENTNNDDSQNIEDITMNYYYCDGFYYTDMMGQKSKYSMSMEEIMKQVGSSIQIDKLQAGALVDLKINKDGNNKILEFTLDPEIASGVTDSAQSQLKTLLGNADANIVIESGSGSVRVNKDGYIDEQSLKMVCKASVDTEEITLGVDMDIIINNPGQVITVEKPVDADYAEIK